MLTVLQHQMPDRVPRFEIWIDGLLDELGQDDPTDAYASLGQDCVMMPSQFPSGSNAWRDGVDEWGRVWQGGMYVDGMIDTEEDLERYSPPLSYAEKRFDRDHVRAIRARYPHHCLIFGTHIGPFTASYLAMGFERFFLRLVEDPAFVRRLLAVRTDLVHRGLSAGSRAWGGRARAGRRRRSRGRADDLARDVARVRPPSSSPHRGSSGRAHHLAQRREH